MARSRRSGRERAAEIEAKVGPVAEKVIGRSASAAPARGDPGGDVGWYVDPRWYTALRYTLGTLMGVYFRLRVRGVANVPRTGAAVLVSNHQSWLDPLLLAKPLPRTIAFMAKAEMFRVPVIGHIAREVGAFPVERTERDPRAIKLALQALREGHLLGMFPEGTRGTGGRLGPLHTGAVRLAEKVGAPIVPACVVGSGRLMGRGARFPRPGVVHIRYGRPFSLAELYGPRLRDAQRREATAEIGRRIEALMRGAE